MGLEVNTAVHRSAVLKFAARQQGHWRGVHTLGTHHASAFRRLWLRCSSCRFGGILTVQDCVKTKD